MRIPLPAGETGFLGGSSLRLRLTCVVCERNFFFNHGATWEALFPFVFARKASLWPMGAGRAGRSPCPLLAGWPWSGSAPHVPKL